MSAYRFTSHGLGSLVAIAAAITVASPGLTQIQPTHASTLQVRPANTMAEPMRLLQTEDQETTESMFFDPATVDADDSTDDPWIKWCEKVKDTEQEVEDCINGLPV